MNRHPRIGQRLAAARLQRGRSQAAVARAAGIAPSYLSRIETGKVQPTFRTLTRVADAMAITLDELSEFDDRAHGHGARCPISEHGDCLLDLIRADTALARERHADLYTPQQIRLLRRFAHWLRTLPGDRQHAVEFVLDQLSSRNSVGCDSSIAAYPSRTNEAANVTRPIAAPRRTPPDPD